MQIIFLRNVVWHVYISNITSPGLKTKLVKYFHFWGCTLQQKLWGQWRYEVWHITNSNWVWSRSLDISTMPSSVLSQKLLSSSLSFLISLFHLSDRPKLYFVLQTPSKHNSTIWAKNISCQRRWLKMSEDDALWQWQ